MSADDSSLARDAFANRAWGRAREGYAAAAEDGDLPLDDLERQAVAAQLFGRNEESRDVLARGYREALQSGELPRAARFAFWLGHGLFFEDRMSEAYGWLARGRQLLANPDLDCVEAGYLLLPDGIGSLMSGDAEAAEATFREARAIAVRFDDLDLLTMTGHGRGRALVRLGRIAEGMAVLDETIVAVTTGEVSPMIVGEVYCGVLEACREVFDLRRAREWTGALTRWCEGQPDLVPHRGPCMVYRAEVMQFQGDWADAFEEARRACDWLSAPVSPEGAADAYYRIGELHRLRGNFDGAEEAYRDSSRLGRQPEPGLPLLWLARGQREAARAALGRALEEDGDLARRAALLDASVQITIACGDVSAARAAVAELATIAARLDAPAVRALAETAESTVLLAEGAAGQALAPLRRAWLAWQRLEAPYEAARVRMLIGRTYRELGDHESAAMEFDAARWVFQQVGALHDLATLDELTMSAGPARLPGGITLREAEVLRLLAAGQTNKEIGATLVISEHTVARHVQNMLAKLGHSSRAGLAAFAAAHGLAPVTDGQN